MFNSQRVRISVCSPKKKETTLNCLLNNLMLMVMMVVIMMMMVMVMMMMMMMMMMAMAMAMAIVNVIVIVIVFMVMLYLSFFGATNQAAKPYRVDLLETLRNL